MTRRYVAEFLGTFAIVFFGCGAISSFGHGGGIAGHVGVNITFGLTVAAMIYAVGHISAAHFNPAVTVAFATVKRFPWRYVPGYVLSQVLGALAGSGLHALLIPRQAEAARFGSTFPSVDPLRAVGVEAVLTFFLMFVIVSVATDKRVNGAVSGLAIGGAVTLCGLFGGPISGCSMNPARSLGPALFAGAPALGAFWIYAAGPIVGAVGAALVYEAIRGGQEHAQGAPNDLALALERIEESVA